MVEPFPEERRQFPRLNHAHPVQMRNLYRPQELFTGSLSRDLSAGGVRVTSNGFLPRDSRLVVELILPESLKRIRAIGRVAWVREFPVSGTCDVGLQFVQFSPEDRESIAGYVERGSTLSAA